MPTQPSGDHQYAYAKAGFALIATAYWISLWLPALPASWVLKFTPMLIAAAVLYSALRPSAAWPMGIGFVAAAAGDIFLALDRGELFTYGLACFLIAQVAYTIAFARHAQAFWQRWPWWLPVITLGLATLAWMWPSLAGDRIPVTVYVCALMAMGMTAATVEAMPGRLFAGALLFVVSDALIGITRFVAGFDYDLQAIIATYLLAQYCIFSASLESLPRRHRR